VVNFLKIKIKRSYRAEKAPRKKEKNPLFVRQRRGRNAPIEAQNYLKQALKLAKNQNNRSFRAKKAPRKKEKSVVCPAKGRQTD
jgi:hypothetical protein